MNFGQFNDDDDDDERFLHYGKAVQNWRSTVSECILIYTGHWSIFHCRKCSQFTREQLSTWEVPFPFFLSSRIASEENSSPSAHLCDFYSFSVSTSGSRISAAPLFPFQLWNCRGLGSVSLSSEADWRPVESICSKVETWNDFKLRWPEH